VIGHADEDSTNEEATKRIRGISESESPLRPCQIHVASRCRTQSYVARDCDHSCLLNEDENSFLSLLYSLT
jgi:hypothetical protein